MTDLKSEHLWESLENAKRDHSPDDVGVPLSAEEMKFLNHELRAAAFYREDDKK